MSFGPRFLAVDWGTSNRRTFVIEDGHARSVAREPRGATTIAPGGFADEMAALRARFGDLPALLGGMVGSDLGWRSVPYVAAPAGVGEIAHGLHHLDARTAIVPGLCQRDGRRADVMRGEECQIVGAVAAGSVPPNATLCLPGTHGKWVRVAGGRVAAFTTAMTGELFALLRGGGVLAPMLHGAATVGAAFLAGVAEGGKRDLAASLFGIRAARLLGTDDHADAASFASGLLIGAEVAARLADDSADRIHVVGDPALGALYAAAIVAHGRAAELLDGEEAFVAGIVALAGELA